MHQIWITRKNGKTAIVLYFISSETFTSLASCRATTQTGAKRCVSKLRRFTGRPDAFTRVPVIHTNAR